MRLRRLIRESHFDAYVVECRFHEEPVWSMEADRWPELILPTAGGFLLRHDGVVAACCPGRLTLVPPGLTYEVGHLPHLPDTTLVIRLRGESWLSAWGAACLDVPVHRLLPLPVAFGMMLLAQTLMAEVAGAKTALLGRISAIIDLVMEGAGHSRLGSGMPGRIERGIRAVLTGRAGANVPSLAMTAAASEAHFAREFRRLHGMTPGAFLGAQRLLRSWALMRKGSSMTEAARLTGFSHVAHLSNTVRRIAGLPRTRLAKALAEAPWSTCDRLLNRGVDACRRQGPPAFPVY